MPMPRSRHLGIMVSILTISGAFAQDNQSTAAVDVLATEKAPNTTAVGQTKPPSRDASPTSVMAIERLTQRQAAAAAITDKICIGCQPDPSATGALQEPGGQAQSPEKLGTKLEELRTMLPPQQQSDLDTVDLASAHRERAKSVEEKTDGLWQSWLVSVCEGCGDQKPVKALRYEEWPDRNTPIITGANEKGPTTQIRLSEGKVKSIRPQGRLEANLSPENVDSIRQMPRR